MGFRHTELPSGEPAARPKIKSVNWHSCYGGACVGVTSTYVYGIAWICGRYQACARARVRVGGRRPKGRTGGFLTGCASCDGPAVHCTLGSHVASGDGNVHIRHLNLPGL